MVDNYYSTMDRHYNPHPSRMNLDNFEAGDPLNRKVEEPIVGIKDLGKTIPEGQQFGNFVATLQAAVKEGVRSVELETNMAGSGGHVGAESYGELERRELREIAKATGVELNAVHVPVQIGNMSGWNPQQGLSVDQKEMGKEEVRKAIEFAADVGARAITIHTGEYSRSVNDAEWNNERGFEFEAPQLSPQEDMVYVVDSRTGQVVQGMRKSDPISLPKFETAVDVNPSLVGKPAQNAPHHTITEQDWIDEHGNLLDPTNMEDRKKLRIAMDDYDQPQIESINFNRLKEISETVNEIQNTNHEKLRPEVFYHRLNTVNQINQMRSSMNIQYHNYHNAENQLSAIKQQNNIAENEVDFIVQQGLMLDPEQRRQEFNRQFNKNLDPEEFKSVSRNVYQLKQELEQGKQILATYQSEEEKLKQTSDYVKALGDFAAEESFDSFAETGIYALRETERGHKNKTLDKDKNVYLAPENIFPDMGYGSHPQEFIDLIKKSRKVMVNRLTEEYKVDSKGNIMKGKDDQPMVNPHYDASLSKKEAEKVAEQYIKGTFDTQHLGMWKKYFKPNPGENSEDTRKRFDEWYGKWAKKMADEGVIGNVHIVDSMGSGHVHSPVGSGNLPIKNAIEYLKKKGYDMPMSSEGHGLPNEMMTRAWQHFGSPVYGSGGGAGPQWGQVRQSYFGYTQPPNYVMRSYVPINDFALWSEVPFE